MSQQDSEICLLESTPKTPQPLAQMHQQKTNFPNQQQPLQWTQLQKNGVAVVDEEPAQVSASNMRPPPASAIDASALRHLGTPTLTHLQPIRVRYCCCMLLSLLSTLSPFLIVAVVDIAAECCAL